MGLPYFLKLVIYLSQEQRIYRSTTMDLQREFMSQRLVHFDRFNGARRFSDPSASEPKLPEQPSTPPTRERSNSFTSFPADLIPPVSTPNPHFDPPQPQVSEPEEDLIISPTGPVLPAQSSILSSRVSDDHQRIFDRQQRRLVRDLGQKLQDPVQRMRVLELEVRKMKIFNQDVQGAGSLMEEGTQSSKTVQFDPVVKTIEDSGHVTVAVDVTDRSQMLEETPASILRDLANPDSSSPSLASPPSTPILSGSGESRRTSTPLSSAFQTADQEIAFEGASFKSNFLSIKSHIKSILLKHALLLYSGHLYFLFNLIFLKFFYSNLLQNQLSHLWLREVCRNRKIWFLRIRGPRCRNRSLRRILRRQGQESLALSSEDPGEDAAPTLLQSQDLFIYFSQTHRWNYIRQTRTQIWTKICQLSIKTGLIPSFLFSSFRLCISSLFKANQSFSTFVKRDFHSLLFESWSDRRSLASVNPQNFDK